MSAFTRRPARSPKEIVDEATQGLLGERLAQEVLSVSVGILLRRRVVDHRRREVGARNLKQVDEVLARDASALSKLNSWRLLKLIKIK